MESTLLLYRTGFAPTNGTSVQVQRLLAGHERRTTHVMWDSGEAGDKSIEWSAVAPALDVQWPFPFTRGRGVYQRWLQRKRDAGALRDLRRRSGMRSEQAWAVCMKEGDARRIKDLLQVAGEPTFVLHVMDLLDQDMSPERTPCFHDLIRRASHVVCISEPIRDFASQAGARSVSVLRCTSDFSPGEERALSEPLRIAMVGTIWNWSYAHNRSLECLESAWNDVRRRFPDIELHYVGASADCLPAGISREVKNHGALPPAQCKEVLRGCHAAFLPVSHPPDTIARFSLPSRLADYLACGLPTIVSVEPGTAVHEFVAPLLGRCVANVQTPGELVAALETFCESADAWRKASNAASEFAAENLSVEKVQHEFWKVMEVCRG